MSCPSRPLLGPCLILLPLLLSIGAPARPTGADAQDAGELVARITRERDETPPEVLVQLANLRSRAAAQGLVQAYDSMGSIYMRREVLRALALLDGVADAERVALEHVANVATESPDRELREAAVDLLGQAPSLGKFFLQVIVESPADDDVREHAMRRHVERAEPSDDAWYRLLYEPAKAAEATDPRTRRRREAEEAPPALEVHRLSSLRRMALAALAPRLSAQELEAALQDRDGGVRRHALAELHRRDARAAHRRARDIYAKPEGDVDERILAARIVAEVEGSRAADAFIDLAQKFVTPARMRLVLADLVAGFGDDKVDAKVGRLVGRGKDYEQIFALHAARRIQDKALDKRIARLLGDRNRELRMAAAQVLGERGNPDPEVLESLASLVERARDEQVSGVALTALARLRAGDPAWPAQLAGYVSSEETDVRNATLVHLGRTGDPAHLATLAGALSHGQWSTRLAAVRGLEALRVPGAVPALIERLSQEEGRMARELADALFRLTGQAFRTNHQAWKAWWDKEGAGFRLASESEVAAALEAQEERRLRQITRASFFGIRVESHRVIFILDISGSMIEPTRGRYVGQTGDTRLAVAQRELKKAIDGLDTRALFNIITFSSGVDRWLDQGVAGSTGKTREEAKAWVDRLGAFGATNLYDAIETAFADSEVDTIFILSDGEPNVGGQTDPHMIRAHVARWNEHRNIIIHTVAVGLDLPVLEWLSGDAGGSHVKFY